MKLILSKDTKEGRADYCDDVCIICGEDCKPHYRFYYYSKETDNKGNPLIDEEISTCSKCYKQMLSNFQNKKRDQNV